MSQSICWLHAQRRVFGQYPSNEISDFVIVNRIKFWLKRTIEMCRINRFFVFRIWIKTPPIFCTTFDQRSRLRNPTCEKFECSDPTSINVDRRKWHKHLQVFLFLETNYFGCRITRHKTFGIRQIDHFREIESHKLPFLGGIEVHDVVWLDVSMNNFAFVNVRQSLQYLKQDLKSCSG